MDLLSQSIWQWNNFCGIDFLDRVDAFHFLKNPNGLMV